MPATPAVSTLTPATRSVIGLAGDLVVDGARHPIAAAVARAARLRTLADADAFAARLGVDAFTVRRCEAGTVAFGSLPAAYLALLDEAEPGVDLVSLRELAQQVDDHAIDAPEYGEVHAVDFTVRGAGGARRAGRRVRR